MSAVQHTPGPWMVRPNGSGYTYIAFRFKTPGRAEYLRNAAGNVKLFRTEDTARAAIAKAGSASS